MNRKTDAQLQTEILAEMRCDDRVDATCIGVEVEHGIVTLTGRVPTYGERVAAVAAAHRVPGVLHVADELHVRGIEELNDTDIAELVREALLPGSRIHSTICDAIVTLSGNVDAPAQREEAVRAVRKLRCVRAVIDHIALPPVAPATTIDA